MNNYYVALGITFVSVFLKGFQHRNVNGNHMKSIVIISYAMATVDVLLINTIVKSDIWIFIPCGTGAALGMYLAIKLHDKMYKKLGANK